MNKKIGRFEIQRELGRGAQSVVYLGSDAQLQRDVAIKTLLFSQAGSAHGKQLLAEARMVSKLRHPNIVPIFDLGDDENGIYLVFEYIPGGSLADLMRRGNALPPLRAIAILRKVLDAIAVAHAKGIVHRDLKPSNILLDESGVPHVMDFGIAAPVESEGSVHEEISGTPAYMAPEYIERRVADARADVFAAGLVLYEMLTGRRAVEGVNVFEVMHRLVNEDVRLPTDAGAGIDDQLANILYKSVARDPEMRYQSAVKFAEALDNYLEPEEEASAPTGKQATLDFLLRRMHRKSDFPALSESVSAINKLASSETESINKLSNSILKDFALTNKILRLVNAAYFRPAGGGKISTVSRAVIVLGFEAVRNIAITVLLFEHMQNKGNVVQLKEDFLRANLAGILAKDISAQAKMRDLEQIFICSLFQNLGRLLSQYYFPEESEEIRRLVVQKPCTEDQAAMQVLGITFEDLGIAIARQWGFPNMILYSMQKLPAGSVHKPVSLEDRMQVMSCFANELCSVIAMGSPETRSKDMRKMLARFGDSVPLGEKELGDTVTRAISEAGEFANIIHINLKQTMFGRQMRQFAQGSEASAGLSSGEGRTGAGVDTLNNALPPDPLATLGDLQEIGEGREMSLDAQSVLTAGIQDISNTLVDGFQLNDILRIILETMYRAMGFKRVVLCIKDARANCMQGRFGFGPDAQEVAKRFRFSLKQAPDIFFAATAKGVDLLISDIDDPKIAPRIPDWYRKMVPAKTFVLFPLNIKGNPVALIYADKDDADAITMPEKELSLLRTLRNQAVLAIKQAS
ncbi:MAG: protein kinase domain-containing protein [Betaproteobacteria bacterium]